MWHGGETKHHPGGEDLHLCLPTGLRGLEWMKPVCPEQQGWPGPGRLVNDAPYLFSDLCFLHFLNPFFQTASKCLFTLSLPRPKEHHGLNLVSCAHAYRQPLCLFQTPPPPNLTDLISIMKGEVLVGNWGIAFGNKVNSTQLEYWVWERLPFLFFFCKGNKVTDSGHRQDMPGEPHLLTYTDRLFLPLSLVTWSLSMCCF